MTGRPSDFSQEIADEICERLAKGESLRAICSDEQSGWLPSDRTVFRWLESNEIFRQQYVRAREVQAETYADQVIDLADKAYVERVDEETGIKTRLPVDHNRSRLQIDARKWLASKLAPKKYGDKVDVAHTGEMTFTIATGVPRAKD